MAGVNGPRRARFSCEPYHACAPANDKVSQPGSPAALPSPPPPTHFHSIRNARARFLRARKTLRFLYLRGTERRRSNDTRPIEKLPRDLTSAQLERKRTSCADDLCSSFFPPFHTLPFRGKRKGQRRAVTSRLLFRKIYNRPFTTSVKIYTPAPKTL